jgi:hypothetical protein
MNNKEEKELEAMEKKDKLYYAKLVNCKRKKCGTLMKQLEKEGDIYDREVRQKCPRNKSAKFSKRYLDCSTDLHNKSEVKSVSKKLDTCSEKKCSKQDKTRKNLGKKLMKIYKKLK